MAVSWFLKHSESNKIIPLEENKTSVGRKGTTIELTGDDSISRAHGCFTVELNTLKFVDTSKYGTSINGTLLDNQKEFVLKDGDIIRFGRFKNIYIVQAKDISDSTSSASIPTQHGSDNSKLPIKMRNRLLDSENEEQQASPVSILEDSEQIAPPTKRTRSQRIVEDSEPVAKKSRNQRNEEHSEAIIIPINPVRTRMVQEESENDDPQPNTTRKTAKNVNKQPTKSSRKPAVQEDSELIEPVSETSRFSSAQQFSESEEQPSRVSRKRPVQAAGGLFAFKTNFVKKPKLAVEPKDTQNITTGMRRLLKHPAPTTAKTPYDVDLDSNDEGVWLSRDMPLCKIEEVSNDEIVIKREIKTEPDSQASSYNFKLEKMGSLFVELEPSVDRQVSSYRFAKKGFVKKKNYKVQDMIVSTTSVLVSETRESLSDF